MSNHIVAASNYLFRLLPWVLHPMVLLAVAILEVLLVPWLVFEGMALKVSSSTAAMVAASHIAVAALYLCAAVSLSKDIGWRWGVWAQSVPLYFRRGVDIGVALGFVAAIVWLWPPPIFINLMTLYCVGGVMDWFAKRAVPSK